MIVPSKKVEEDESEVISRILEIRKILSKPPLGRLPFQTVQLCRFFEKILLFRTQISHEPPNVSGAVIEASMLEAEPGQLIFKEGQAAEWLYILTKGALQLSMDCGVFRLEPCSVFGQLEILFSLQKRVCSARAITKIQYIGIRKDSFLKSNNRKLKINQTYSFLERNPYFGSLGWLDKMFLSTRSQEAKFQQGSYILRAGDTPDKVLCILAGTVTVLKSIKQSQTKSVTYEIDLLQQGDVTGQFQSINGRKSEVSLYCRTGVSCVFISMSEIKKFDSKLLKFFSKPQNVYPDDQQIRQLIRQQQKENAFKSKFLNHNKKQRLT